MPPTNAESSYDGQDTGSAIVAILGSMTAVSAFFVAARLFVRIKLLRNLGLDDYLIVLAMLCAFANLGLSSAAVASGSGQHFDTLTMEQQQNVIKYTIAAFCPGILSFAIPKLAVVALLTKLMNPSQAHRIVLWCSSSASALILFGCVIILYAQCTPSRSQWDFSIKGECWSKWVLVDYAIVAGGISALMDLYLAVYPAVVLAKLQMNIKKKAALAAALGIGSVACIVAAYKCTRLPGLASDDFSYTTANLVIWTCVEGSVIIIASCIPILQPLIVVIFDRNALSSARRNGDASYNSNLKPNNHQHHNSDIALSGDVVKSSKARNRGKMGVSFPTEIDSQDSILREEESQSQPEEDLGHGQPRMTRPSIGGPPGKITRIDEVTVSSSEAAGQDGRRHRDSVGW